MGKTLDDLISTWRSDLSFASCFEYVKVEEARDAVFSSLPEGTHPAVIQALQNQGISRLYSHQSEAFQLIRQGNHIAISTGTASGKTLCYTLPVINYQLLSPGSTALFIYPTKALANDQLNSLQAFVSNLDKEDRAYCLASKYDGDTPSHLRSSIRQNCKILITNPDMLHTGILPHHTLWDDFFSNLRFIVLDELHVYRGVFGSHVANLIRRLKRVANFYDSYPWFITTSATIGNPKQLAETIIEEPVTLINNDGSPHGKKYFIIHNPPITHPDLGLRKSASSESLYLASNLISSGFQTLIFTKSRRGVEIALRNMREMNSAQNIKIQGYRSGYTSSERRFIENGLKNGDVQCVISTNALELGVDIGGMSAVIMVGYPGTIAATRQQAGRAGRRSSSALSVLVASSNPLDQFLTKHPEYLTEQSPENALVNPDNLLILLNHIKSAAFELPFRINESFGKLPASELDELLQLLVQSGYLTHSGSRYFWISDKYPANELSLRTTDPNNIQLITEINNSRQIIGSIDKSSSYWMAHPGAIYLHDAEAYEVEKLDLAHGEACMHPSLSEYFTEAQQSQIVESQASNKSLEVQGGCINYGEINITSTVTGFKKISWLTREVLGTQPLDMPSTHLQTMGFWLSLSETTVAQLRENNLWLNDPNDYGRNWKLQREAARLRDKYTCQVCGVIEKERNHHVHHKVPFKMFATPELANKLDNLITLCPGCHQRVESNVRIKSGLAGLGYILRQLSPLFLMCDINDIGVFSDPTSSLANGLPAIVIYDQAPGGLGLSDMIYQMYNNLIRHALDMVANCKCLEGCPSCVGPSADAGNSGKSETLAILKSLAQ